MNALTSADAPTWVVVQAETTGLAPQQHRIVEIAVVVLAERGTPLGEATTLVNPGAPIDPSSRHGIRDSDVVDAPSFPDLAGWLVQWLAGKVVVGHNLLFTLAFLEEEFDRAGVQMPHVPGICTRTHAPRYLPDLPGRSLEQCCAAAGVPMSGPRSALGDARAAGALFAHFLGRRRALPSQWRDFIARASSIPWPDVPMRNFSMAPRVDVPPSAADHGSLEASVAVGTTGELPGENGGAPRLVDAEPPIAVDGRIPRYVADALASAPRRRDDVASTGESTTDADRPDPVDPDAPSSAATSHRREAVPPELERHGEETSREAASGRSDAVVPEGGKSFPAAAGGTDLPEDAPLVVAPRRRKVVLPEGVESFTDAVQRKDLAAALAFFQAERMDAHERHVRELEEKLKAGRRIPASARAPGDSAEPARRGRHAQAPDDRSTSDLPPSPAPSPLPSAPSSVAADVLAGRPLDAAAPLTPSDVLAGRTLDASAGLTASGSPALDRTADPSASLDAAAGPEGSAVPDRPGGSEPAGVAAGSPGLSVRDALSSSGATGRSSVGSAAVASASGSAAAPIAGWYPDPQGDGQRLRWWDGAAWTHHTHG